MEWVKNKIGEVVADLGNWDLKIFFFFFFCFFFAGPIISGTIILVVVVDKFLTE